jgi:outer membrane protein
VNEPTRAALRSLLRRLTSRHAAALLVAAPLAVAAPRIYAQARVAVVDMQRAARETQQGQRALGNLRGLFQKRQEDLDARQQTLTRLRDSLQKEAKESQADQAALQQRMQDYQKQFVDLQQNYLQYQQELSERETELTKAIYANMDKVIRQVGTQEHYTAIFDQQGVIWSPQDMDLTDRVIQLYNQQYPPGTEPAPATAPTRPAAGGTAPAPSAAHPAPRQGNPLVNPHPREESHPTPEH